MMVLVVQVLWLVLQLLLLVLVLVEQVVWLVLLLVLVPEVGVLVGA